MKNIIKNLLGVFLMLALLSSCKKTTYTLGIETAPSSIVINTVIVGQDATHPNGDGSGDVTITVSSPDALAYMIDYDASDGVTPTYLATSTVTHKYTTLGVHTYTITVVATGKGGIKSTTVTKDVTLRFDFVPDPAIVTNLTNDASKTWIVDKSVAGQLGVGPWTGSSGPDWWSAGVNEKVACCNCFYTSQFTFTKNSNGSFTLGVTSPDGAFTKTGALTTLPGIPATGGEGCYNFAGGTSSFSLTPSSSGIANSTKTDIQLAGTSTFIGYGAVLKDYEILSLTSTAMYLRVQGTETGNAWYIKLKSI